MAALTKKQIRVVGSVSGNQPQVRVYEVNAGQVLRTGDIVVENAGKVDKAAATVLANDLVLGVALHAADPAAADGWYLGNLAQQENSGGTFGGTFSGSSDLLGSIENIGVHVALANADNIFEVGLDTALALAQLGAQVQLGLASGIWSADDTGATKTAVIVAIPNYPGQAIGDTNARVWIQFLAAASDLF